MDSHSRKSNGKPVEKESGSATDLELSNPGLDSFSNLSTIKAIESLEKHMEQHPDLLLPSDLDEVVGAADVEKQLMELKAHMEQLAKESSLLHVSQ